MLLKLSESTHVLKSIPESNKSIKKSKKKTFYFVGNGNEGRSSEKHTEKKNFNSAILPVATTA